MLDTTLQTNADSRPDSTGLRYIGGRRRLLHRNTMKFYSVVVDSIPHNFTEAIVKAMLEEVVVAVTSSLFGKNSTVARGQC